MYQKQTNIKANNARKIINNSFKNVWSFSPQLLTIVEHWKFRQKREWEKVYPYRIIMYKTWANQQWQESLYTKMKLTLCCNSQLSSVLLIYSN
jgi:hypothetical protein